MVAAKGLQRPASTECSTVSIHHATLRAGRRPILPNTAAASKVPKAKVSVASALGILTMVWDLLHFWVLGPGGRGQEALKRGSLEVEAGCFVDS